MGADQKTDPGAPRSGGALESVLLDQVKAINDNPLVSTILQAFNGVVLVVNEQLQIVGGNLAFLEKRGFCATENPIGQRQGEVLSCVNAAFGRACCGTTPACASCGALQAMLKSQQEDLQVKSESLLTLERPDGKQALELSVMATPLDLGEHRFTVVSLQDISDRKRREALEGVFFHDMLNTIGGLHGWTSFLPDLQPEAMREAAARVHRISARLLYEVRSQQALAAAERNEILPVWEEVSPADILAEVRLVVAESSCAAGKHLDVSAAEGLPKLVTDRMLLTRVLINMTLNAFEASAAGQTVCLSCERVAGKTRFAVHSDAGMPDEVAAMIFKRTFTTKSKPGHGLGTYAMKLFGEEVLGGRVDFSTGEAEGTTFFVELPDREGVGARDAFGDLPRITPEGSPIPGPGRIQATSAGAVSSAEAGRPRLEGRRILVVDDVTPVRKLVVKWLAEEGASVEEAQTGRIAEEEVLAAESAGFPYHVVLLDLGLPRKSGQAVLKELRSRYSPAELPVLIITAEHEKTNVLQCVNLGIQGYMLKPVAREPLISMVAGAVKR